MSKKVTKESYFELKKKNEAAEQIIREMFERVKALKESVKYWQKAAEDAQEELESFLNAFPVEEESPTIGESNTDDLPF